MIKYESKFYIVFLTSILSVLSIYNIILVIFYSNYIPIIALCFQLPMLYFIINRKTTLKIFIKIWCVILLIGGIAGWVSIISTLSLKGLDGEYNAATLGLFNMLIQSIKVMVPVYFLMFLNESITELDKIEEEIVIGENN